jgi:hypothetical protein
MRPAISGSCRFPATMAYHGAETCGPAGFSPVGILLCLTAVAFPQRREWVVVADPRPGAFGCTDDSDGWVADAIPSQGHARQFPSG